MKNKLLFYVLIYCFLLCSFAVKAGAQNATIRFNDTGVSIAFKAEKVYPNSSKKTVSLDDSDKFYSQMYVEKDGNKTLHRVVFDRYTGVYFGYDLEVIFNSQISKFEISIKPLSIEPVYERTPLKSIQKPIKRLSDKSISKYPKSFVIEDGDTITLDLLEKSQGNEKFIDVIKIKINKTGDPPLKNPNPENSTAVSQPAQDFSPDVFQTMKLTNVKIFVNGVQVANPGGIIGPIMYLSIPDKGRFIFSLSPHEGYDLQKIGTVEGNEISFRAGGDNYRLLSDSPILAVGGGWNLWVLYDPNFRPDARFSSFSPYWLGAAMRMDEFIKKN